MAALVIIWCRTNRGYTSSPIKRSTWSRASAKICLMAGMAKTAVASILAVRLFVTVSDTLIGVDAVVAVKVD